MSSTALDERMDASESEEVKKVILRNFSLPDGSTKESNYVTVEWMSRSIKVVGSTWEAIVIMVTRLDGQII